MKKIILSAASVLVGFSLMAADSDIVSVKGKGVGVDETAALKDAYRDAVETAVGMFVDAEQLVKNDELIKDEILTQSNAYIEGYKVLEKGASGGLTTVKIQARVRKQLLTKKIAGVMPAQVVSVGEALQGFHAKDTTQSKRNADGAAILKKELSGLDLVKVTLDYKLASSRPIIKEKPQGYVRKASNSVEVDYLFRAEINHERYFSAIVPRLKMIFDQISIVQPQEVCFSLSRSDEPSYEDCVKAMSGVAYCVGGPSSRSGVDLKVTSPDLKWNPGCGFFFRDSLKVLLITKANKIRTIYRGLIYEVDRESAQVIDTWYKSIVFTIPEAKVSFLDEESEPLSAKSVKTALERMSVDCCKETSEWIYADGKSHGTLMIAPWFLRDKRSVSFFWQSFDLDKSILPLIKSIKVEVAE